MFILLLYFFIAIVVIQLVYYLIVFGQFAFVKPQAGTYQTVSVSVIVCAKNEEENVTKFIPLLAEQNYADFEIILINDASSDRTLEIFEEFEKKYSNIRLVKVENNEAFWGNKKYALTLGIKTAKKDYLLFTDADCYPVSKDWIANMTSYFTEKKSIVLGYGAYEKIESSFLNKLIRFETVLTAVQYFSWAKIGSPYMGVGRNLAYKREEFFNVNGFINHIQVRSGDDDLFINEVATAKNTTLSYLPESFTYSKPKTTYGDWFAQKRRHTTTAKLYKFKDQLQLGLFFSSQFLFFVLATILLSFQFEWMIVLGVVLFRYLFSWIVVGFAASKLKEKDLIAWFPVIEVALIFSQLNIFFVNIFSKPVHWK